MIDILLLKLCYFFVQKNVHTTIWKGLILHYTPKDICLLTVIGRETIYFRDGFGLMFYFELRKTIKIPFGLFSSQERNRKKN